MMKPTHSRHCVHVSWAAAAPPVSVRLRGSALRRCGFWARISALVLMIALGGGSAARAAEGTSTAETKSDEQVEQKTVTGEVMGATKRAISVEFSRTPTESTEMLLPVDGKTAVERLKSLADLRRGDRVSVEYQQTYREDEHGERIILRTIATRVALLRSASNEGALRGDTQVKSE